MNKKKRRNLLVLIVVGFAFIVWADAICDVLKWDQVTPGTIYVFVISSIILYVAYLKNEKKVKHIMAEQLGR